MTDLLFGKGSVSGGVTGQVTGEQASWRGGSAKTKTIHYRAALFAALAVLIGLKAVLLLAGTIPFNSDEAIVALMARHILEGERPLFFYGQAYMGSLDAYLAALGFYLFGQKIWVLRALQTLLYLGTVLTAVRIARVGFGSRRTSALTAWFLAIPTVTTSLYTTVSLGGYGETLLIGNIILLLALRIATNIERQERKHFTLEWLALGFTFGLGFWASGLTLVYSVPALVFLVVRMKAFSAFTAAYPLSPEQNPSIPLVKGDQEGFEKERPANFMLSGRRIAQSVILVALGGVFGGSLWIFYAFQHGIADLLVQLGGGMISGVQDGSYFAQILQHVFNFIVFGISVILGLRPSWEFRWLALPLIPLVLIFWGIVAARVIKKVRSKAAKSTEILLLGAGICLVAGFVFTPFGADPSGRYFLPFAIFLALFTSDFIDRFSVPGRRLGLAWTGLILIFNLWGIVGCAIRNPPGLTTQIDHIAQIDHRSDPALIEFLLANGERRGYSNYWVSYPLAFESQEELIFTPRLPYHEDFRYTPRDDRYPAYDEQVDRSDRAAYITTNHPALEKRLREGFSQLKVSWKEAQIGDYHVFYALSRHVHPEELDLGVETR